MLVAMGLTLLLKWLCASSSSCLSAPESLVWPHTAANRRQRERATDNILIVSSLAITVNGAARIRFSSLAITVNACSNAMVCGA